MKEDDLILCTCQISLAGELTELSGNSLALRKLLHIGRVRLLVDSSHDLSDQDSFIVLVLNLKLLLDVGLILLSKKSVHHLSVFVIILDKLITSWLGVRFIHVTMITFLSQFIKIHLELGIMLLHICCLRL